MKTVSRAAEADIISELHSHRHEAGTGKVVNYLQYMQQKTMVQLTTCNPEDTARLQGEYAAYKRVFAAIMYGITNPNQGEA